MSERLRLAVEGGHVVLPDGNVTVFGATSDSDLGAFDKASTELFSLHRDVADTWAADGWQGIWEIRNTPATSVVILPRARDLQRAFLREAVNRTDGPVIVDGSKTNGVDSFYRDLKRRTTVSEAWSKAHGKVFSVHGGDFSDWPVLAPFKRADGWWVAPGVFSADGIDKASQLLADALPQTMNGDVIDLGSGWGFLSRAIRAREGVGIVTLVENDRLAHQAGLKNAAYEQHNHSRNVHHWADALAWRPDTPVDHVVTNPPFHVGRAADPSLGQGFIRAAAAMLKPKGQLWLVANRHLPYESTLKDAFRTVELHAENPSFKIFHATSPTRCKG